MFIQDILINNDSYHSFTDLNLTMIDKNNFDMMFIEDILMNNNTYHSFTDLNLTMIDKNNFQSSTSPPFKKYL